MRGLRLRLLAVPLLALVTACGGGGGGSSSAAAPGINVIATAAPTAPPLSLATSTPSPAPTGSPVTGGLSGTNTLTVHLPAGLTSAAFNIVSLNFAAPGPSAIPVALTLTGASSSSIARAMGTIKPLALAVAPAPHTIADHPYGLLDGRKTAYTPAQLPGAAPAVAARRTQSALAAGAQQAFFVEGAPIGTATSSYVSVPFTLVAVTTHINVWMQTSIAATYASRANAIATDAETAVAADIANIGPVTYDATALAFAHRYAYCDATGTQTGSGGLLYIPPYTSVNLLLVDPAQLDASVGADFSPTDLFPQGVANCFGAKSNEAPTVTIGLSSTYTNLDYFISATSAHEFTHLAQYVTQNIMLGHTGNGTAPGMIEEGLAEFSRDLLFGHPDYGNIYQNLTTEFLAHPQTYSILGMNGFEDGTFSPYRYGNYGAAYLFMRYTADRYGTGFVKTYLQTDPLTGTQNSFAALASAAGATSFSQLFNDFGMMLAANAAGLPNLSPTNLTSFSLSGNYTGPNPFFSSSRYIMNGVTSSASVPANASVPMYAGGVSIVNANGAIGGSTFVATDGSGTLATAGAYAGH